MNIMLISQCSKQALTETRRVLDQFAERKGERTWQTAITQQGLDTLRKMLRKTARRNTAVACHWIKSGNRTELLWIVGNQREFNEQGTVPTNMTESDVLRSKDENQWHTVEDLSLLAGIAGLFHDFGKGNTLFQAKLKPAHKGKRSEPYRHEWLSLRMFQAFVGELTDREWLEKLLNLGDSANQGLLEAICKDGLEKAANPFAALRTPLSRAVGWLIVSHHLLPKWPDKTNEPRLNVMDSWLTGNNFDPSWNSPQCKKEQWSDSEKKEVWTFPDGSPVQSRTWRGKAKELAERALKRPALTDGRKDWLAEPFSLHLARLLLMLADHHYSAVDVTTHWQDKSYKAFANTDKKSGKPKQKLDEHLIGVGQNALLIGRRLPSLRKYLPVLPAMKEFRRRSVNPHFRWQDKAYELACNIRERTEEHGFFGVNMASTGCGKTFANGRIMYGLANEKTGCRFSVALGLRTLTLQTGDALRKRLYLNEEDLAVLIGSQSVRLLHQLNNAEEKVTGSESADDLFEEHQHVSYEGTLDDGRLSEWLKNDQKLHKLVSAPILVSTIDHLIPATESERGGHQIAPMLRLLTSDLVLDEPDDFDLADLPALARLVNWAGMLGSRVLLSSATLPPSLVEALFDSYCAGRRAYQNACGEPGIALNVCCAWFDENGSPMQSDHGDLENFRLAHESFVRKRVEKLAKAAPVRQGQILPVKADKATASDAVNAIAKAIFPAMQSLHLSHNQIHPETGKRVSVGLVRIANIRPLVAVAKELLTMQPESCCQIHYCIYHSRYPLAVRSAMEKCLDGVLTRHDRGALWQQEPVRKALADHPEINNHIFVVIATAVAEVGRDHDYDWAIAEPSSMRSLIQLAGRIQRHRSQVPASPNLLILSHNFRTMAGEKITFRQPGFESDYFHLKSHDLHDLLEDEQYRVISAIPRITARQRLSHETNLADLEHVRLAERLFGRDEPNAARWWKYSAHWYAELQRRTRFRASRSDTEYLLYMEDETEEPRFNEVGESGELKVCEKRFERVDVPRANGVFLWGNYDVAALTLQLAESQEMKIGEASRKFAGLRLPDGDQVWLYNSALGVYRALE